MFYCCCSVPKSCPTLCNPMDCSMPGSSVLHYLWSLLKFMSIESVMLSNHLILCRPLLFLASSFPSVRVFSNWSFCIRGWSIGASASTSVLPLNSQWWFPLRLTGLIFLQSKRLSRTFSNTTVQKHQFFGAQPSLWFNSHIYTWLMEKP